MCCACCGMETGQNTPTGWRCRGWTRSRTRSTTQGLWPTWLALTRRAISSISVWPERRCALVTGRCRMLLERFARATGSSVQRWVSIAKASGSSEWQSNLARVLFHAILEHKGGCRTADPRDCARSLTCSLAKCIAARWSNHCGYEGSRLEVGVLLLAAGLVLQADSLLLGISQIGHLGPATDGAKTQGRSQRR